jgi:hypothetical protein
VEVGPDGRIFIADRRTKAIHVFDSSGRAVGRCIPKPEDLKETSEIYHIAISKAGDIYASLNLPVAKYLHFRKDMTREGWAPKIDADKITQKWYFHPSSDYCWILGYKEVFLVQDLKVIIKGISRRADGRWIEYPDRAAVAADGSLAVLSRSQSEKYLINIYNSSGDAQKNFDLPFSMGVHFIERLAYDGRHVFAHVDNSLIVYDLDGQALGKFTLPSDEDNEQWNGPWLAAQGKEIWFIESQSLKLHRFAFPNLT